MSEDSLGNELIPCAHCGEDDSQHATDDELGGQVYQERIQCNNCGCTAPDADTWNMRAPI